VSGQKTSQRISKAAIHPGLKSTMDPTIKSYIDDLRRQYGKYATSAEKVREMLDKTMGDKTLTELLFEARVRAALCVFHMTRRNVQEP